jgi:thioredoxin 2
MAGGRGKSFAGVRGACLGGWMSETLTGDERGVILDCPACGTANRLVYGKLGARGRCGGCKGELPRVALPVVMESEAAFGALSRESPLPVVIDFWAPWCGPCRMMAPEFAAAARMAAGEMLFVKVNTDEQPEVAAPFRIQGIPAFVVLRGGRVAGQASGARSAAQLLAWVRSV